MLDAGAIDRLKKPITDVDINKYFPEKNHYADNVVKYSDLAHYSDIYQLLPKDRSYKIILIESKKNSGHWVCIMRYGDIWEFFDAYGVKIDGELKFINTITKRLLGESRHFLTDLFKTIKSGKVIYNNKRLQSLKSGSATCGRWVILRILMMRDFFYTLEDFIDFIEKNCKVLDVKPDYLVSLWIK
jgi:hypothetical protein